MKLKDYLKETETRFLDLAKTNDVQAYVNAIKESGDFKVLKTRVVWALLNASFTSTELCDFYKIEGVHDAHIETLGMQAVKVLNLSF